MRIKPATAALKVTAIIILLFITAAVIVAASPEKTNKFGCHRCTADCDKYGLLNNEFHCHGNLSVQGQSIQIAPRLIDDKVYRRVANVIDGDTLTVYYGVGGKKEKVRLLGIEAPKKGPIGQGACYSNQAAQKLTKLAYNKFVLLEKDKLQEQDKDKYGRLPRYATLLDKASVVLNEEMIKGGFAKAAPELTTTVENYKGLENEAKEKKLGLWSECFKEPKNFTITNIFPFKGERIGSRGEHA